MEASVSTVNAKRRWSWTAPPPADIRGGPRPWDVLVFPIVDWAFRRQRPQHLAQELARKGHRVFYFETGFSSETSGYRPVPREVADGVFVVRLPCYGAAPVFHEEILSERQIASVISGIDALRSEVSLGATVSIVGHPFWSVVSERLFNNVIVYDCMDRHGPFRAPPSSSIRLSHKPLPVQIWLSRLPRHSRKRWLRARGSTPSFEMVSTTNIFLGDRNLWRSNRLVP